MERSSPPDVFLGKGVLKISSKFKGEHLPRSAISVNSTIGILLFCRAPLTFFQFLRGCALYFKTEFPAKTIQFYKYNTVL